MCFNKCMSSDREHNDCIQRAVNRIKVCVKHSQHINFCLGSTFCLLCILVIFVMSSRAQIQEPRFKINPDSRAQIQEPRVKNPESRTRSQEPNDMDVWKMLNLSVDETVYERPCRASINNAGLGNRVRRHMDVRAVCFWALKKCQWQPLSTGSFLRYLSSNYSTAQDLVADYELILDSLDSTQEIEDFRWHQQQCGQEFASCDMSTVESGNFYGIGSFQNCSARNEYFQRILRRDVLAAFHDFNESNSIKGQLMAFSPDFDEFPVSRCDITIHFRCGDIIINGHHKYPVHKFERYSQEITSAVQLYRNRTGVDCTVPDSQRPFHVNIISQFAPSGVRGNVEQKMGPFCRQLSNALGDALRTKHAIMQQGHYEHRVVNNDVTNDLWLMYNSPMLLLTYSSFPKIIELVRQAKEERSNKVTVVPHEGWENIDPMLDLAIIPWRESQGLKKGHFDETAMLQLQQDLGFVSS